MTMRSSKKVTKPTPFSFAAGGTLLTSALLLSACSMGGTTGEPITSNQSQQAAACSNEEAVTEWPLPTRVAQLLMGGTSTDLGETAVDEAITALAKGQVGGINLLGTSSFVIGQNELAKAVDAAGPIKPLLAVDEEGGQVQRLSSIVGTMPSASAMADTMTPAEVANLAEDVGASLRSISINVDLAPVVDVGYGPLGSRTFGDDAKTVAKYGRAFAEGLQRVGVTPTFKHFPGMGRATGNTDFGSATTPPLPELEQDLAAFAAVVDTPESMVMMANAIVPGLTAGEPATLSTEAYALLRAMGFTGPIITDSLGAAAISNGLSTPDAAVEALRAGADIVLWDNLSEAPQVRKAVVKAVKNGSLLESSVNESVVRVLDLKNADLCSAR